MDFLSKLADLSPKLLKNRKIAPLIEIYRDLEKTLHLLKKKDYLNNINLQKLIAQLQISKRRLERKIINTLLLEKQSLKRKLLEITESIHRRIEQDL